MKQDNFYLRSWKFKWLQNNISNWARRTTSEKRTHPVVRPQSLEWMEWKFGGSILRPGHNFVTWWQLSFTQTSDCKIHEFLSEFFTDIPRLWYNHTLSAGDQFIGKNYRFDAYNLVTLHAPLREQKRFSLFVFAMIMHFNLPFPMLFQTANIFRAHCCLTIICV